MLSLTLSGLSLPTLQLPLKGLSTTFGSAPASQKLFGLNSTNIERLVRHGDDVRALPRQHDGSHRADAVTFGWRVASARHDDRLARERPRWIRGKCAPKRLRGERARKPRSQHHV